MIVVPSKSQGLLLVRQSDHAAMSLQAARAWEPADPLSPPVWDWLLEAVRLHDDGWLEAEERPSIDPEGRPHDFKTVEASTHIPIWRRSLELARRAHPYVLLLVAQHGLWLYTQFPQKVTPGDQSLSESFIDELTTILDTETRRLHGGDEAERRAVRRENLRRARRLVSFFDRLSLVALRALDAPERTEPLCFGSRETSLSLRATGGSIEIDPWPFRTEHVPLETTAREVSSPRFATVASLRDAIARAPSVKLRRDVLRRPPAD